MPARDSEFPERVARLKSALGELVEQTDAISQRAKRRNTSKIARVSQPILPAIDMPEAAGEVAAEPEAEAVARAPTEPPAPPPARSAPPEPEASRYSIVSPSPSRHPKKR